MKYNCKQCKKSLGQSTDGYQRKSFCDASCQLKYYWRNERTRMLKLSNEPTKTKASSERMKKNNPMDDLKTRLKAKRTNKRLGTRPTVRGGNGKPMPVPQRVLLSALGIGWFGEHSVSTGSRGGGYPTCYKIDIANPDLMIAIEVDGHSHNVLYRKAQDQKKTDFLEGKGWRVMRFKNKEVMKNLEKVLNEII